MPDVRYIVAGCKPWNRDIFRKHIEPLEGDWYYIEDREKLTLDKVRELSPRFIFFIHWSWKVPDEIVSDYECVCFHMTDVPYGRGGSPLQNLILRGHTRTKLTALRMTQEFDAGPVYMKEDLDLGGSAEEIYKRATMLSVKMIGQIILGKLTPVPQSGDPVIFKRRRPEESEIPELNDLEKLYDFIRMLDAEGYPPAFLEYKGFRFEFTRALLEQGKITGKITITPKEED